MDAQTPGTFRFTRESRIRIDRDGNVWHEGEKVEHVKLAQALASWVDLDPESDRYILRNPMDWCFITVDDAPIVVRAVRIEGDRVDLILSDGREEPLDWDTLRIDGEDVPYCTVREGRLPARFTRTATFTLFEHAELESDGGVLTLGARRVSVQRVPTGEGAPKRKGVEGVAP